MTEELKTCSTMSSCEGARILKGGDIAAIIDRLTKLQKTHWAENEKMKQLAQRFMNYVSGGGEIYVYTVNAAERSKARQVKAGEVALFAGELVGLSPSIARAWLQDGLIQEKSPLA